jgi:predicted Rossmann fold flavoprotein
MKSVDVAVIGAGAAGLFVAARAGQASRSVLLIEHAEKLAEKIRISGGGRCNFTNRGTSPENFLGENPHFCRSALAGYTPADFLDLLVRHRIAWHEKHRGQLFCDDSAEDIIAMLVRECEGGGVERWQPCTTNSIAHNDRGFRIETSRGPLRARQLVIATGGLSIPKIGATDFGLRVARQFGHRVVEPRPALVPLTFDAATWRGFGELAGVSLEVAIESGAADASARRGARRGRFVEDLLFTHRGLSGPAVLQASSYWRHGQALLIDLAPGCALGHALVAAKSGARGETRSELARYLPARLAALWVERYGQGIAAPIAQWRDAQLQELAASAQRWVIEPTGSEGWRKAEVMAGGVATDELSSQTFESRRVPGLYFIGEVVDVTGWLGGYNFQWAWSSAAACARALAAAPGA